MKLRFLIAAILTAATFTAFSQQADPSLIPYRHGDLWGYANPDKSIAIKPIYNETNWFVAGYAVVKKGNKYGYINKAGKLVIPFKFYSAKPFTYGYFDDKGKHTAGGKLIKNKDTVLFAGASLKPNGAEVCIDIKGLVMSKCPAINENRPGNNEELVTIIKQKEYSLGTNSAVYDKITDDYKLAADEHTYYIGIKNNRYGLINNTFDVLLPFEYDSIKKIELNGGTSLLVSKNNRYGMFTGNGTAYIPVEQTKLLYILPRQGTAYFIESKEGMTKLKDASQQDIINANFSDIVYDENRGFILTGSDNTKGYYFLDKKFIAPKYSEVRSIRGGNYLLVKTTTTGKMGYVNAEGVEYFDE
jgi:WG containing repeat